MSKIKSIIPVIILCAGMPLFMLQSSSISAMSLDFVEELDISLSLLGYLTIGYTVAGGSFMLIGSLIQRWFDVKRTAIISIGIAMIGTILTVISHNYASLLLGRLISGIGYGICAQSIITIIAAYYSRSDKYPYILMINGILTMLGVAVGYILPGRLMSIMNSSWRIVYITYLIIYIIYLTLFILIVKDPIINREKNNKQFAIIEAAHHKNYWFFCMAGISATAPYIAISIYFPIFLQTVRNYSELIANSITGLLSLAGIIGIILGGVLAAKFIQKKRMILISSAIFTIFMLILIFSKSVLSIIIAGVMVGVAFNFRNTPIAVMIAETAGKENHEVIGAANAIINGSSQIASVAISPIFFFMTNTFSMTNAFLFFALLSLCSILFNFLLKENIVRLNRICKDDEIIEV